MMHSLEVNRRICQPSKVMSSLQVLCNNSVRNKQLVLVQHSQNLMEASKFSWNVAPKTTGNSEG